jgi:prepilin-type N-terminal cleavage/methylation domain-containing protein
VRNGFTLIEVLVVLVLLTIIMGVIVPAGSKMLGQFSETAQSAERNVDQQMLRLKAFIHAQDTNVSFEGRQYTYKANGVVLIHE